MPWPTLHRRVPFPSLWAEITRLDFRPFATLPASRPKNIGIIHIDRHADIQEFDLERMHTTPYFHATNLSNVRPENLMQIGIGGRQVPRAACKNMVERRTTIFTMDDLEEMGIEKVV
jgi:arginase family enzyme